MYNVIHISYKSQVFYFSFTEIVLHLELRRSPQIPSTVIQTGVSPSFAQSAVLVRNVPYFLDASLIEDIFIKILDVSRKSVCVFVNDCDLLRREYFAVFDSKKHAETLINKVRNLDGVQLESFQMGGSKFYCQQYQKQFEENPAKVRKDISEWLREFTISEQRQKKSALLKNGGELKTGTGAAVEVTGVASVVNVGDDGGGWQVVTCHGKKHKEKGVAFTHANQKKSILLVSSHASIMVFITLHCGVSYCVIWGGGVMIL